MTISTGDAARWFVCAEFGGARIVRASRTDLVAIRRGEEFLGIPFDALNEGQLIEEKTPGVGTLVEEKSKASRGDLPSTGNTAWLRKLEADPRFVKSEETGVAFIIVGARDQHRR